MDGDSTLINLLAGNGSLPEGEAAGDLLYFNGTNWISKTVPIPFNFAAENISDNALFDDVIPLKHLLKTISIENKTALPVNIVITTTDARELMNETIESLANLTLTLNIPFSVQTGINVTSPDWNHTTVNLSLNMEKLF